ncbi:MAG TPA: SDR family NAD(P)-dependent oxidoreductase [Vicinamibacterales bacterium]|nr:SDR family NAD(P)-dependent oxidoreductase [Vicinamibacterales bacterium]
MAELHRSPKVALVTGANRGIGLEVCRQLAAAGLHIVATSRRGEGDTVRLDVTDAASIRACAAAVGPIDVLVNNAAILVGEDAALLETSLADVRATFEANVFGALAVCQAFVPGMVARRYGRVVNVSSGAGQLSSMGTYAPAYSMSKAALNALTIQLAAAVKGSGVLVNCVNPGWVRTRMGGASAPRSVEQGADTIVWAATLPDNGPTGAFLSDRRPIAW